MFSMEDKHGFVEAAIWADDNKDVGITALDPWHYQDKALVSPDFKGEVETENINVTWSIPEMIKVLTLPSHPKFNNAMAVSFAWRYLLHLVGDIHQPLHSTSYYSPMFPNGDLGGNLFTVVYPDNVQITNLHALWDACVDQYGSMYAPLSDDEWNAIGDIVTNLTQQFSREQTKERVQNMNFKSWAEESYGISRDHVYAGINPGEQPSKEYIDSNRAVINEQLAVGGYRLADLLRQVYAKHHPVGESTVETLLKRSE